MNSRGKKPASQSLKPDAPCWRSAREAVIAQGWLPVGGGAASTATRPAWPHPVYDHHPNFWFARKKGIIAVVHTFYGQDYK